MARRRTGAARAAGQATLWLSPSLLGLAAFFVAPLVAVLWLSGQRWNLVDEPTWAGADVWRELLTDGRWWHAVAVTLGIGLIVIPAQLALGMLLGRLLAVRLPGSSGIRALFLVPWLCAPFTVGVIARWMFAPSDGVFAQTAGRRLDWVSDPVQAPLVVAAVVVWQATGFAGLLYAGAFSAIPSELRAAAALDGAGPWRTLLSVELPQVSRTTLFLAATGVVQVFGLYDTIVPLTGGGPSLATESVSLRIVAAAWQEFDIGAAAAMAVLATAIELAVIALLFILWRRRARR